MPKFTKDERQKLIAQAVELGRDATKAKKDSSQRLQEYVNRNSPNAPKEFKPKLGFNRQELIQAVSMFSDAPANPARESSVRLEEFLYQRISGTDDKIEPLTMKDQHEIRGYINDFGLTQALSYATYSIRRVAGVYDKNSILRVTVAAAFESFYDAPISHQELTELMRLLPQYELDELISGVTRGKYEYVQIFQEYADVLRQRDLDGTRKTLGVKVNGEKTGKGRR